jgi:glycosyltransferase involved in cell wall biosynthesis
VDRYTVGLKRRILLVQQELRPRGGANTVAAWILQALRDDYDLTVLTETGVDIPALNRFYGTSLRQSDVSVLRPHALIRRLLRLDPDPHSIQPVAYLMRMARRYRGDYDLVMSAGMEEMDLGGPGLIYVHYPFLSRFWPAYQDSRAGVMALLRGKTRPWMLLAGYSVDRMKQNTLLANSEYTRRRIHEAYGIEAMTLYPPVTAPPAPLDWSARESNFISIGVLKRDKRMDWIIRVLGKIQRAHPEIRLHLAGSRADDRDDAYYFELRALVEANCGWVELHEDLSRESLLEWLGRSRYYIHALKNEHFGIAPAEALMAGCIPFVHNSGGQVEIAGGDPRLCYDDDNAVQKILDVLDSSALQLSLQESIRDHRELFGVERFMSGIRAAVRREIG